MKMLSNKVEIYRTNNRGWGIRATQDISRGDIILTEEPLSIWDKNFRSDMFYNIYVALINHPKKYKKFHPYILPQNKKLTLDIGNEFSKIKDTFVYKYLTENYSLEEIFLFAYKYIQNAFDIPGLGPVILDQGRLFNHSCYPNVIFGRNENKVVFIACRTINKGEELYDNYIDIKFPYYERQSSLSYRYNFICRCNRCVGGQFDIESIIKYKNSCFTN